MINKTNYPPSNKVYFFRKYSLESGFTLIELLIVLAIIGILAAIAVPQFSKYRLNAFNMAASVDLKNCKVALEASFADKSAYPH